MSGRRVLCSKKNLIYDKINRDLLKVSSSTFEAHNKRASKANPNIRGMSMSGSKPTIADLQQQLNSIKAEIESRRISARSELRSDIEQMLKDADLSLSDVFPELAKAAKATAAKTRVRAEVAARYKDPSSGLLWSGRGRSPKWVEAILQARGITIKEFKQLSDFSV